MTSSREMASVQSANNLSTMDSSQGFAQVDTEGIDTTSSEVMTTIPSSPQKLETPPEHCIVESCGVNGDNIVSSRASRDPMTSVEDDSEERTDENVCVPNSGDSGSSGIEDDSDHHAEAARTFSGVVTGGQTSEESMEGIPLAGNTTRSNTGQSLKETKTKNGVEESEPTQGRTNDNNGPSPMNQDSGTATRLDPTNEELHELPMLSHERHTDLPKCSEVGTNASTEIRPENDSNATSEPPTEIGDGESASGSPSDETESGRLLRGWSNNQGGEELEEKSLAKMIRKASVAVTGGALVVAGIPLIPMPTPGGVVVVGSGMALLATEFPAARRVLDRSRQGLANMVGEESEDEDEETVEHKKRCAKVADLVFQDGPASHEKKAPLAKFLPAKMEFKRKTGEKKKINLEDFEKFKKKASAATNGTKRNVKKFIRGNILPLMAKVTSNGEGNGERKSVENAKLGNDGNTQQLRLPTTPKLLDT